MTKAIELLRNPRLDIEDITPPGIVSDWLRRTADDELAHIDLKVEDMERLVLKIQGKKDKKGRTLTKAEYANVRQIVRDAVIEDSIDKTPTIRLTLYDPDWDLLNSGALDGQVDINPGGIPRRWYRLDEIDVNDDELTLTFATRNAVFLSMHKTPVKFSRGKMTRAQAIQALTKKVKIVKIKMHCPQLKTKQKIAKYSSDSERQKKDERASGFTPSDKITVKGVEATPAQKAVISKVVEAGIDLKMPGLVIVAAVMCVITESGASENPQPANPPYVGAFQQNRAHGWPGTGDAYKDAKGNGQRGVKQGGFYGMAMAEFKKSPNMTLGMLVATVQGVVGSTNPLNNGYASKTDRWRGEAQTAVNKFGGVDVEDPGTVVSTSSEVRLAYEFMVGEPDGPRHENYLAAIYRWADQVNWRAYWVRDVLHYMSEEDLFKAKARIRLRRYQNGIESVRMKRDRSRSVSEMILQVRMDRWVCPVGTVVIWDEGTAKTGKGRWLVSNIRRSIFDQLGEIILRKPIAEKLEPTAPTKNVTSTEETGSGEYHANYADLQAAKAEGARAIVEHLFEIAKEAGGNPITVVSDYRAGSTTTSGNPSDHASNDSTRAARDIGQFGLNALTGPPTNELDKACEAIGRVLGRPYTMPSTIIDTWTQDGYRWQVIWRTTKYGGHEGHIHVGVRKA